eukprot:9865623-Heterocapsa_arctica.AAC.1
MEAFQQALHEVGDAIQLLLSDCVSAQIVLGLDANVEISHGLDDCSDSLGIVGPLVYPSSTHRTPRAIAFLAWCLEYQ